MDHHVPSAVTQGLRLRGVDVLTCHEDERPSWTMLPFSHVLRSSAGCCSRRTRIFWSWPVSGREFVGILYGHQLQLTIGQAVRDLELAAEILERDDTRNRVEYLPL